MKKDINNSQMEDMALKQIAEDSFAIIITDINGRYRYANEEWRRVMQIDFDSVKGSYVHDIIPDTRIDDALAEEREISGYSTINTDGRKRRAFSIYKPLYGDNQKMIGGCILTIFTSSDKYSMESRVQSLISELDYYKRSLTTLVDDKYSLQHIIGESACMLKIKDEIQKASHSNSTVMITGETGVGKELVANAIHGTSRRSLYPFVKINCAGIPKDLLESELFGYVGGAFTGANKAGKMGKFEQADKGSIFLDEINQLTYQLQPKLLRVIQEREVERIGSLNSISINVRIIAATNCSLENMVKSGEFREDLYYRLNVVNINVPPLRNRREDIPLLVERLTSKLISDMGLTAREVSDDIKMKLMEVDYSWPGNVRELQNVLERALNMAYNEELCWGHFASYFEGRRTKRSHVSMLRDLNKEHELNEREIIQKIMASTKNKSKAARQLGISRTMLYKKIKKYNINV